MCGITPGSHVAVIGGGMIGQIMLRLSRLYGAVGSSEPSGSL